MSTRRTSLLITVFGLTIIVLSALLLVSTGNAAFGQEDSPTPESTTNNTPTPIPDIKPTPTLSNLSISDEECLSCHGQPGDGLTLKSGEVLDLYVPADLHQSSVHGEMGYACVQCHTDVGSYPHPEFEAENRRDVTLKLNSVCTRCHSMQAELSQDSVHAAAQTQGESEAAVCVDCHTAHEVRRLNDPETHELLDDTRTWIPERCALCHNAIYQKYEESVHGAALTDGNPDVPTCIDCHGVHNIEDPTTSSFRLKSPEICAKCHTDPEIMNKYSLTTDVLDTYVADFHGTTVAIFEKQSPDAEVNKPVCYDCHGIHDISKVDDPETGLEMKNNLLNRCQECHPDANANFPSAWMSHYIPSPEHYPLTYYVNLFYKFFIPLTLGGMTLLVVMDAGRLLLNRSRHRRKVNEAEHEIQPVSAELTKGPPVMADLADPIFKHVEDAGTQIDQMENDSLNKAEALDHAEPDESKNPDQGIERSLDSQDSEAENE